MAWRNGNGSAIKAAIMKMASNQNYGSEEIINPANGDGWRNE